MSDFSCSFVAFVFRARDTFRVKLLQVMRILRPTNVFVQPLVVNLVPIMSMGQLIFESISATSHLTYGAIWAS